MEFSVGIKVAARGLEWDVTEVEQLGAQQCLRLTCVAGDLAGLEWHVLCPTETVTVLRTDPGLEDVGPLAAWRRYHIAWLLDQMPGAPSPPGRIEIEPYQRVPLLRAQDMVRPRLLLADGVGLGKTIQAGLIAAEMIVQRRAHRILVVSPPGPLLRQWEREMRIRFGLRFTPIADGAALMQMRNGLELGGNPFEANALCLTSMDFCKQHRVLDELERTSWDLVIIDEAHHCVADGAGLGVVNQRRRMAEVLARRADGLLLLTATPHDGHDLHFASLIALLDPSLVDGTGRLIGSAYRRYVVRRLKSHIRDPRTGGLLFRERVVIPVRVNVTEADAEPVRQFHLALSKLVAPRLLRSRHRSGLTDALAFVSLLKRSMSSIAACLATLRVVVERYTLADKQIIEGVAAGRERRRALRAFRRRGTQLGVLDASEEADIAELEAEAIAADLVGTPIMEDLLALIRLGEAAAPHDPKLAALVMEIRLIRIADPDANILVYTEYADSQRTAVNAVMAADFGGAVLTISGADSEAARMRAAERCAEETRTILISTDSLAEGLNLHQHCCHLVHLVLPYNPNRLEQRNGRIDRYGQRHDPQIRYLYLAGTFEERLLLRLIAKYEAARTCLSFMPNTLGASTEAASLREPLCAGFSESVATLFDGTQRLIHSLDLIAEDTASEAYRDLLREIDRAFASFDHMAVRHGWMHVADVPYLPLDWPNDDIDLPAFVASTLPAQLDEYGVPADWTQQLEGLAGFNHDTGTVRLANDPQHMRNAGGQALLYPGRAHPLTRRAIAWAQTVGAGRVSAASGHTLSLLLTYVVESAGTSGTLFRKIFALRLFPDGRTEEQPDFMALSESPAKSSVATRPLRASDDPEFRHKCGRSGDLVAECLWHNRFADWATIGIAAARPVAATIADALAAEFAAALRIRIDRDSLVARAWLSRRTSDFCGAAVPLTGDLFDFAPPTNQWQSGSDPEERLARFAVDPAVPVSDRRDAAAVLVRYQTIMAGQLTCAPPVFRTVGMLMLCP